MFGKNTIRSRETDPGHLAVESIFYTLQGEGPLSGQPALFIRLAGCNLACHFCDTQFETRADVKEHWYDIATGIVQRFTQKQRALVVLTGGEPMRQNWLQLATFLIENGTKMIQVETAGTLWQDIDAQVLQRVMFVCSPKTPNVHDQIKHYCDHWKYIVRAGEEDPGDGLPMYGTQAKTQYTQQRIYRPDMLRALTPTVWLSPCDEQNPTANKMNQDAARDLCLKHGYRLSLQVHKIVGVE